MPAVHMKNTHTCLFTSRCTHLCSGLTCAHGDGLYELVPPAVGPHQQSQVGLLYQLVHCVLPEDREITRIRRESPACSLSVKIPKWFIFTRICHSTFRFWRFCCRLLYCFYWHHPVRADTNVFRVSGGRRWWKEWQTNGAVSDNSSLNGAMMDGK